MPAADGLSATGFLLKDIPPEEIVSAVHRVARGEPVQSLSVTRRLIARAPGPITTAAPAPPGSWSGSTSASGEVAAAVGTGRSNAEIGAALSLSVPTVKSHVSSVLAKLGLNTRVQIALLVHDAGLLDG